MPKEPVRNYAKCMICGCRPEIMIQAGGSTCFLCQFCDKKYFDDLELADDKLDRLIAALKISQEKSLTMHYALNIARGLYGVREARKKQNKRTLKRGKAGDIFTARRRRPGCFK